MNKNKGSDTNLQADLTGKDTEGMVLKDEELDQVTGGFKLSERPKAQSLVQKGSKPKPSDTLYSGGRTKATKLGDLDVSGAGDHGSNCKPVFPDEPKMC